MTAPVTFRRVQQSDLPLIHAWRNRPHLKEFYPPSPMSFEAVVAKYVPCIRGTEPTFVHVAFLGDVPFGQIQCYRNADYPDYAREVGLMDGFSIDLFIGEPELQGQGLGKRMLGGYLHDVAFPLFPDEQNCYIFHRETNKAALACSKSVGFQWLRNFVEGGLPNKLFVISRANLRRAPY